MAGDYPYRKCRQSGNASTRRLPLPCPCPQRHELRGVDQRVMWPVVHGQRQQFLASKSDSLPPRDASEVELSFGREAVDPSKHSKHPSKEAHGSVRRRHAYCKASVTNEKGFSLHNTLIEAMHLDAYLAPDLDLPSQNQPAAARKRNQGRRRPR